MDESNGRKAGLERADQNTKVQGEPLIITKVKFDVVLSPSPDSYLKKMLTSRNMWRRKARKKRG